jgi:hypothetical protein
LYEGVAEPPAVWIRISQSRKTRNHVAGGQRGKQKKKAKRNEGRNELQQKEENRDE